MDNSYIPLERKWIVLFPEGGFLCKRRETSQKYAKKNNLPILENVTLPRVGAMRTIFDKLGPVLNNDSSENQLNARSSKLLFFFYLFSFILYREDKLCQKQCSCICQIFYIIFFFVTSINIYKVSNAMNYPIQVLY